MTRCYACGKAEMTDIVGVHEYDLAALPYRVSLVGVPILRCPECGEEAVTIPDPEGLHAALSLHITEVERTLLPEEIRFLRRFLDLKADELADVMGVDVKTLSRWENGRQKMGKVAERLLRLIVHHRLRPRATGFPETVFPKLLDEGGVETFNLKLDSTGSGWRRAG